MNRYHNSKYVNHEPNTAKKESIKIKVQWHKSLIGCGMSACVGLFQEKKMDVRHQ